MSPRTPRLTARVIKQLTKAGFEEIGQTGSCLKLFSRETKRTAIVPIHSNKVISIGTLKSIQRQADINFE